MMKHLLAIVLCLCVALGSVGCHRSSEASTEMTVTQAPEASAGMAAAQASDKLRYGGPKQEDAMSELPVVRLQVRKQNTQLELSYEVKNRNPFRSIWIFDRLYDRDKHRLNPNWAYVENKNSTALVTRQLELLPRGLAFEFPEVPYVREIAPGASASGTFTLPLPLKEDNPYLHITHRGETQAVALSEIIFQLGWCDQLPPRVKPITLEGEVLYLFPYGAAAQLQKLVQSAPVSVHITGAERLPR